MPIVGNRNSTVGLGRGYAKSPIAKLASAYADTLNDILNESGIDTFSEPNKAMMIGSSREALKEFFVSDQEKLAEAEVNALGDDPSLIEDARLMAEALFENDREAIMEYSAMSNFNPVIGMTFPIHKNILMNNVFDKGSIQKVVSEDPKFTISMETRTLITPDGEKIDMFKEQYKMRDAINSVAPMTEVEISLPEQEGTDVIDALNGVGDENLSIETYISAVHMKINLGVGDVNPETGEEITTAGEVTCWIPTHLTFTPAYGEYDRTITQAVEVIGRDDDGTTPKTFKEVITGYMKENKFGLNSIHGLIDKVKLSARFDTSTAMFETCSVAWSVRTDMVEIPSARPINVPISPEEVKDIGALYNINQLSKVLSLIRTVLANYKDDEIKAKLDESFMQIKEPGARLATTFDFAPRNGYLTPNPATWRQESFMDFFDSVCTGLYQALNDPNMTISVFGSPELIRKITPTEYTYNTPSNIGPIDLDFCKTVCTSDNRVYQFISSDKLRGNSNLIVTLNPRNSERIVYRIYDYQMYISNEIRNAKNPSLPAVHAFERWKFVAYQPVQGRIKILNPTGYTSIAPNDDPIGTSTYSDFNMLGLSG